MQKRFLRTIKAVVAFSLVFSLSMPAFAASSKEEVQQNLAALENQKAALQNRLANLQANKTDTESYIAELDAELSSVYEEIQRLSEELAQTEANLAQTQSDLEVAKAKEVEQYEALKARIRAMYEAGDTTMMEIFMQAEDISTILNANEYISKISDYDNALLEALNETRQQIEALELQLEEQKAELENLKAEQEAKQEELEMVMEAKRAELSLIVGDIGDAYASISNTEAAIAENNQILADIEYQEKLAEEVARKKAEEEKKKQEQQQQNNSNQNNKPNAGNGNGSGSPSVPQAPSTGSGNQGSGGSTGSAATGGFIWPCAGGYISSGFGGRTSPTAGASSNHQCVDIAAGAGSAIYASDGGVVTTASYSSVRGYYIVVSHGNGYSTLYQHCSSLAASVGQSVSQGQVIAYVGSTGVSTGPHLHFEVWMNGVPVDPQGYI